MPYDYDTPNRVKMGFSCIHADDERISTVMPTFSPQKQIKYQVSACISEEENGGHGRKWSIPPSAVPTPNVRRNRYNRFSRVFAIYTR